MTWVDLCESQCFVNLVNSLFSFRGEGGEEDAELSQK